MMWKLRKAQTGKVYAAKDLQTLQSWCRDGRAREEDSVRSDEDTEWRQASHVFELAAFFAGPMGRTREQRATASGRGAPAAGKVTGLLTRAPGGSGEEEINLDLTSMMDMTFILLIFLMVVATPAFQQGLPLNLPEAGTSGKIEKTDVTVSIGEEGQIQVDGKDVTIESLPEEMRSKKRAIDTGEVGSLILRADGSVKHERVVEVMDIIVMAGINKISVATKPKSKP